MLHVVRQGLPRWSLLFVSLVSIGCAEPNGEAAPWTTSARGLGPVTIGMTRSAAGAVLEAQLTGPAGINDCTYLRAATGLEGVLFMEVMGQIVRNDVTAPGISTAEKVAVGTPIAEVLNAYPSGVTRGPHKYTDGEYLTVAPDVGHRIVFETDRERVTRYRVGRLPEVEWVEGCS